MSGDLRWEKQTTKINNVLIYPKQPVRYMVEKYKNVSFIRKELLVANEEQPQEQPQEQPREQPQEEQPVQQPTGPSEIARRTRSKVGGNAGRYPNMV